MTGVEAKPEYAGVAETGAPSGPSRGRRLMLGLMTVAVGLTPLLLATGWMLNDSTAPKPVALAIFTGALLCAFAWAGGPLFRASGRETRLWLMLLAAQAILVTAACIWSQSPELSAIGTRWRAFGLVPRLSILLFAACATVALATWRGLIMPVVRAMCVAGLLAGSYALLQALEIDPWIPRSLYREGTNIWDGLRPPATLGHANYLANFLLYPVFLGIAMMRCEWRIPLRAMAACAALAASAGILVSGTRAGVLGLGVGAICWLALSRRQARKAFVPVAAVIAVAAVLVAVTPLSVPVWKRIGMLRHDSSAGPRVLLWKDTAAMALRSPVAGYGPETFGRTFPLHESERLASNYPNYHHESPHNIFLEAWIEQGIAGPLLLIGGLLFAVWVFRRGEPRDARERELGKACVCALAAATASQQFAVFVIPTALYFTLHQVLLIALGSTRSQEPEPERRPWFGWRVATVAAGIALIGYGVLYAQAEYRLKKVDDLISEGQIRLAMETHAASLHTWQPIPNSELWYSQRLFRASSFVRGDLPERTWADSVAAAERAVERDEVEHNAYYWLSILHGSQGDGEKAEAMLRAAIAAAPQWYAPRWMLSQLLEELGREAEGRRLRAQAIRLNGGRTP